jgi:hypothetical protein
MFYLALKGGDHNVGAFVEPAGTGVATTTDIGHNPEFIFITSQYKAASGAPTVDAKVGIGATNMTTSGIAISYSDADADTAPDADVRTVATSTATSTTMIDQVTTGTASLKADAKVQAFTPDAFSLNWSTNDATQRQLLYWTIAKNKVLTASVTGTQNANLNTGQANQYVGGAFRLSTNTSSTMVSQIIVSETNTVNANTDLSNLDLYYEQDAGGTCTYDGNENLYGTAASFNGSDKATVTGSLTVDTTTVCFYPLVDVGAGASGSMDLEISTPSTEITVTVGTVSPGTAVAIAGSSSLEAATISISGTCKQWDQTTDCSDTGAVAVAVDGVLQGQTQETVAGTWSIASVPEPGAAGAVVTVFIDGAAAASNRAAAVTKWVSGNITGVVLHEGHLTLGSADNQTISNANISQYDNTSGDADVFFDVDASSNLTVDANGSFTNERLLVRQGNTYQPDASGATRVITTQNLQTSSTATLTANGSTFRLGQNWVNNGTFTAGTSTAEFSGATSSIDCSSCTFYNLTASSTAVTTSTTSFTVSNILNVAGTFGIDSSQTINLSTTLTLSGTINGTGTLRYTSGTNFPTGGTVSAPVMFDMTSSAQTIPQRTFGTVIIQNSGGTPRTATLGTAGGQTITFGDLTLQATGSGGTTVSGGGFAPDVGLANFSVVSSANSKTLTTGAGTWTVSGNFNLSNITIFTASAGNTLTMSGSGTLTSNAQTLQNLTLSGTVTLADATHTVAGNLSLAGGTITPGASTITMSSTSASIVGGGQTLNNLTINPSSAGTITLATSDLTVSSTLDVAANDTLSIAVSRTLTHTGATLTLPNTATINGSGTLIYRSTSAFPTTGNASSSLTFDATSGNQIISARSFGGAVTIDNSGATTGRTVTLGTGASQTITFQSGLDIAETGSANDVTLTGASNNPTVNLTGNLACSAGTGNNLTTGAGTWTVSGSVDFTNCNTVTASTGNTLVMGGTGTLTSNSKTLRNLTFSGTVTLADAIHTVSGNLSLAGGTITAGASTITMSSTSASIVGGSQTLNNLTIDPSSAGTITLATSDLTVGGTLSVAAGDTFSIPVSRTVTHTGATLTLPSTATISGSGTLVYRSTSAFPATGNASSSLTFDATANDQTVSARTYGGAVKIDNSGASSRSTTLAAGTITFQSSLDVAESGSGSVNLTGATNDPAVNVTGNLTCSTGTNTITTGAGTWTVSGTAVNFTNCTLTTEAGNTLVVNGSSPTLTTASQTFNNLSFSGATTPTISGSATASGNVTLVSGTTLTGVMLTMTSSSAVLVGAGNTLPNLTIDGTGASVAVAGTDLIVSGTLAVGTDDTLSIGVDDVLTAQGTITLPVGGTITGSGTLRITDASGGPGANGTLSSIVRYDASSASIAAGTFDARTYGGAVEVYANSGTAKTVTFDSGSYTFSGGLTVTGDGAGDVTLTGTTNSPTVGLTSLSFAGDGGGAKAIAAGSGTWTSTSGNVNFTNGSWSGSAGNTLALSGSGQTLTTNGQTFENVDLGSATTPAVSGNLTASGTVTFAANTTLTGVTLTMTGQGKNLVGAGNTLPNLTINGTAASTTIATSDLTVSDALSIGADDILNIASDRTLTHTGTSAFTLTGTVQGPGRLTYQSASAFPTGGAISSILRYDATNNAQTATARTYGGAVEIYSNSGSARTVTMASGTYALSSTLNLNGAGGGSLILDGATNTATGTVAGDVSYTAGGGGETITLSASPWTMSGALDISGGTFTAPAGTLNVAGNYTNTGGTFTHNSGTLVLNGTSPQSLTGTLSGSSALNNLTITNNSGSEATPSVVLNAATTAATSTAATASSSIKFLAGATYTFSNINWAGNATNRVMLRSSASGTPWILTVPSTANATVTYVDVRDSDASLGDTIPAADSTNLNSGGNTNWDFVISSPFVSSTADDVFEINAASTTIANINFKSGTGSPGGRITSSSDIRARIPSAFPAIWDSSVGSITCEDGNACDKILTTGVTYESSNKIAVVNVLENFTSSEWVQISGLKMGGFTAVQSATTTHRLRVDGSGDAADDATDSRTKTVKGKLTVANHNGGQSSNAFDIDGTSLTNAGLLRFEVVPTGENMDITTTTVSITSVSGIAAGNITNPRLYQDVDSDGVIDVGEPPILTTGTVSIAGGSGTITFGGSWTATTTSDLILRADVASIDSGDNIEFSVAAANVQSKGATTLEVITPSGTVAKVNHGRPQRSFGGGESSPAGGTGVGGGDEGGGSSSEEEPPPSGGEGGGTPGGGEGGSAFAPETERLLANITTALRNLILSISRYLSE